MSIQKLEDKLGEIRSQSDEKFGIKLGGQLFDSLDQAGRLSNAPITKIDNDPSIIDVKILDNEFFVYKLNNNSCEIEIGPRSDALIHEHSD